MSPRTDPRRPAIRTQSSEEKKGQSFRYRLPPQLSWIPANWTWGKVRLALRCAVAAWLSSVLFIIPTTQIWIGQASFLLLIAAFLSPPVDPFLAVLERELLIVLFLACTWGWSCLGIFLANLARNNRDDSIPLTTALFSNGQYVEAAPCVVLAIFIFLGTAVLLYIRVHQGPGPYLFATLFSCIGLITTLTTACLIPYPYYLAGRAVFVPIAFHSIISVLSSLLLFPESLSRNFTNRLVGVFSPLEQATSIHLTLLQANPSNDSVEEFKAHMGLLMGAVSRSEAALGPLAQAARLLPTEVIYSRFSQRDWRPLQDLARRIALRAQGMTIYFTLIDPTREKFPITPMTTRPGSPVSTRPASPTSTRPSTPMERHHDPPHHHHLSTLLHFARLHHHRRSSSHHHHHHHHGPAPVGVFESQRYLDLEAHVWHDPRAEKHTTQTHALLQRSCVPLLEQCKTATTRLRDSFAGANSGILYSPWTWGKINDSEIWISLTSFVNSKTKAQRRAESKRAQREERVEELRRTRKGLLEELERFKNETRLEVVKPYTDALRVPVDRDNLLGAEMEEALESLDHLPSHRYLFNCYVYHYHLMRFADMLSGLLEHVIRMEESAITRQRSIWSPVQSIRVFVRWLEHVWAYRDGVGRSAGYSGDGEEEDPGRVQHVDINIKRQKNQDRSNKLAKEITEEKPKVNGETFGTKSSSSTGESDSDDDDDEDNLLSVLPQSKCRDPDALPPNNAIERVGNWIYLHVGGIWGGNALYAVKAGVLTTVMSLPFFLRSSAQFAYDNRFIWGIIMAQLTSARFLGDTTFGFITRIFSTFLGGVVGLCLWYIGAPGLGAHASPYAIGGIFAFCFPFFFFVRLYIPGPPMRILIFFVTIVLVIGYSYQDQFQALPSSPGVGWSVAWRRFLLVSCGVTAAFIFSFFPPAFTLRRYQRTTLATTCAELGIIYCAALSYASTADPSDSPLSPREESPTQILGHTDDSQKIVARLVAIRAKLNRLRAGNANVIYEVSLRGRWPKQRYTTLFELQMQLSYMLAHFLSVIEHLEPAWIRAMLSRTRFSDPNFQGDVLAVITMISTALRDGTPLPQVTPCPLIDRFLLKFHGLNVIHREAEEDYGLPRTLTKETLENEQYLMFCVGVSTAFGIVSRLDRLMVAAKEIVGEQYHIHGLGFGAGISVRGGGGGIPLGSRTNSYAR